MRRWFTFSRKVEYILESCIHCLGYFPIRSMVCFSRCVSQDWNLNDHLQWIELSAGVFRGAANLLGWGFAYLGLDYESWLWEGKVVWNLEWISEDWFAVSYVVEMYLRSMRRSWKCGTLAYITMLTTSLYLSHARGRTGMENSDGFLVFCASLKWFEFVILSNIRSDVEGDLLALDSQFNHRTLVFETSSQRTGLTSIERCRQNVWSTESEILGDWRSVE